MIVVVGSRDLVLTEELVTRLTSLLSTTNAVAVRATKRGGDLASPIERLASVICEESGIDLATYVARNQRAGVYHRDINMVRSASTVFAVFSPDRVMEGGTAHVVKAALDAEVPVEAYTFDDDGSLIYLGSDEGNPYRIHTTSRPDVLLSMMEEGND